MALPDASDGRMAERRHELYADLMDLLQRLLAEYDVGSNEALLIASDMADRLANHWGGQNITFPKEYRRKLSRLELEIFDAFKGHNLSAIAQTYNISERGLRKLIARVTKRLRCGNQPGLFEPPALPDQH
ncbi:MAG TPA: Mor transcription activator family protein [Rhodoferax sp.]|nr:Mor transcription activator family protein [Rhodoferax sp.]